MTAPSPKPTEIAPLREILRKDGVCLCAKCRHLGTGSEFTVSNYPADDYSSCCPKCDNTNEETLHSVESLSESLANRSPVESAPALAPLEKPQKEPETFEPSNKGSFLDLGGYF